MPFRRAASVLFLLVSLLLVGCSGQDDAPVQQVALSPPAAADTYTPTLEGPLRVLSATPSGPLRTQPAEPQPIAVTFSRPMVPLGETPPVPDSAFTIAPAVEGTYRWEGTQTLVFVPDAPLPPATEFSVTLRPVVSASDGETMAEPYTWTFETPRPRLAASSPADGASFALPDTNIRLRFTLPVEASAASDFLSFPSFTASEITNDGDSTLVITPDAPLTKGKSYEAVLEPGLPTPAGPLGLAERTAISFRVHPDPAWTALDQPGYRPDDRFSPGRGLELSFATPVRFDSLRQALSADPALDWPTGIESRDDQVSTTYTLPLDLRPETTYRLTIDGLTDQFGQTLPRTSRTIQVRGYEPSLSMDEGLLVIESEQAPAVPLRATNVESATVGLTALRPDQIVPALRTYDASRYYGPETPDSDQLDPVSTTRTLSFGDTRNAPVHRPLRLDSLLTGGTGLVGVRLRWTPPGEEPRDERAFAQVTNLGITGKFSPHQNVLFVTELSSGAPVADATVTLRDAQNTVQWTGTTDAQGRVETPGWHRLGLEKADAYDAPVQYAIVEHDGDVAFTSSRYDDGVEPYRFGLNYDWSPDPTEATGSLFTARGLYRAGDTVHVKGILRQKTDGDWTAITDSVRVLIYDPRDERVADRTLAPSSLGTFDFAWASAPGAAQGRYELRAAAPSDTTATHEDPWRRGGYATGSFRVDAFRRAAFSVTARTAADDYVAGDFFEGSIDARYLFGAGMAGQPVQYDLTRRGTRYQPPGYDGYQFGPVDDAPYETLVEGDTTLDSTSTAHARAQLPGNEAGAPATLTWSGTVTAPSRQTISGRATATLHPGRFYVGLKPSTSFLDLSQDSVLTVDLLSVDPAGQPVGEKSVTVELVREQWNSVREVGPDGRLRWRSEKTETVVQRRTVTTAADAGTRLRFVVPQGGQYQVRAVAQDLRGNTIRTQTYVYASGEGYVAWQRDNDDRIELIAEQDTYAPGETARLMVQSPYEEATALITVEREGILRSRVTTLTGSTPQVEIPLTEAHIPNVYVSVILLKGRTAPPRTTSDPGAPGFKIGYASLRVDPGRRHLNVAVEPSQDEYRPGETVSVDLRVTDASGDGVQSEVAFSAADAGVLNLIDYALPDPFDTFYGPRPLGVTTSELRAHLVEQRSYGQKSENLGGGGGGDLDVRTDFSPLAHWAPAVQTNARGRATVTFDLPESLTTFRLMGTAVTADHKFGAGQSDITVTQPLVLQPALPRFARQGDEFEAGVLVTNRTDAPGTATVTARATGLTLAGDSAQSVSVPAGATREVRFDWRAPQADTASVAFRATMDGTTDALRTTLPVQRPRTKQVSATFASTDRLATETLRPPAERLPGLGGLDVQVSSTALVGLDGAVEHLFAYPYGCLEQRTSRIRPLLLAGDLVERFDLSVLDGKRDALVRDWMGQLEGYWVEDGFGMWTGAAEANPYVTAYTVLALAEAKAAGYALPQPLTQKAVDALAQQVRNKSERPRFYSAEVWADTRALMLYALARHGRVLETEISALADDPPESAGGLSHLLRTVTEADRPALNPLAAPLAQRLRDRIRVESTRAYLSAPDTDDYDWIFSSDVRATAFGLTALLEYEAREENQLLAQRMIRYLMDTRQGGHWASTQDNAAVVGAFQAYADVYEQTTPDFTAQVQLAGKPILERAFRGPSLDVETAAVSADALPSSTDLPLQFQKDGPGTLYYTARLQTYTSAPVGAASQGLSIERRIEPLTDRGTPTGASVGTGNRTVTLDSGRLVRVTLRVTSPTARHYVVVDDALPAGLEPVNAAFATAEQGVLEEAETGTDRWWGSFNHTEMQDDRVLLFADELRAGEHTYTYVARATTPGTFTHPPAEAEMMYRPETRGRTATGRLVVQPPGTAQAQR